MATKFSLSVVVRGVDQVSRPFQRMSENLERRFANVNRLGRAFSNLSKATGATRLARSFGAVGGAARDVGSEFARLGARAALVGAAGAAGVIKLVDSFGAAGEEAQMAAQSLGFPLEALQELRFSARLFNIDQEQLDASVGKFAVTAGKAAAGGKAQSAVFRALGVDLRDQQGRLKPVNQLFQESAGRLSKISNAGLRAAATQALFGKGALKMIPLLTQGSAAFAEQAAQARRLNVVMGQDQVEAAGKVNDAFEVVRAALEGVRNTIGAALAPQLTALSERFTSLVEQNQPLIRQFAEQFAQVLPVAIEAVLNLVRALVPVVSGLASAFNAVSSVVGPTAATLGILAVTVGAKLTVAVVGLATALKGLGVTLAVTPIGVFLLALTAVTIAVVRSVNAFQELGFTAEEAFNRILALGINVLRVVLWPMLTAIKFITGVDLGKGLEGLAQGANARADVAFAAARSAPAAAAAPGGAAALPLPTAGPPAARTAPGAQRQGSARVRVDFANMPRGTRVATEQRTGVDLDVTQGFNFAPGT